MLAATAARGWVNLDRVTEKLTGLIGYRNFQGHGNGSPTGYFHPNPSYARRERDRYIRNVKGS